MTLTKRQALEMFQSDDLIGIGMEADAVRRTLHPAAFPQGSPALLFRVGNSGDRRIQRPQRARHHRPIAGCGAGFDSGRRCRDSGRRSPIQDRAPEVPDRRLDQRASHRPSTRHAHHCNHDVWGGRKARASRQSLPATVRIAGRDWRIYRVYSVELPAVQHRFGRPSLGRSYRRRIPEGAGDFATVSVECPQRSVELGHARSKGLPDGTALWRKRCRLGDARGKCGARGGRNQLHHRGRVAPDHPRCRLSARTAGHLVSHVFPQLASPDGSIMRTNLGILVCWAALAARVAAQSPATAQEPAKASLKGSVVKEPGGEAVKKAIIELIGENQDEGANHTATSDQDGHFKITGIAPGRYRLFVERAGFIQVEKKRRRSEGLVLAFDAGQELKDQVLRMLPAAVIAGRVVDEDGDPMPNVEITVLRRKPSSGRPKLDPSGSAQTNDLGEYRVGGLLAGKYYVSASPLPNFQSLVPAQKSSDDRATIQPDMAYVTTYYPNTPDRTQAAALELHADDDLPLDFSLARVRAVRIRGSVAGLAPGTKAVVLLRGRDSNSMYNTSEVDQDGKFEIQHVPPGAYTVMAMTVMADRPQVARSTVEVNDADVDGVRLAPLAGATVRGKVRLAGNGGKADASLLVVYLRRTEGEDEVSEGATFTDDGTVASPGMGRVKADRSFELKNVPPGVYELEVSGDSKGISDCFVESVVAGPNDVATSGLDVAGGTISVEVTVSSGAGAVDGMVADDKNQPVANAAVVAVPEAKYRKRESHYAKVATDQHGHFSMHGLRPGEYTLFAWENLEGDDYFDPEYLKKYQGRETAIRLDKGGRQNLSLKVIPAASDQP